MILVSKLCNTMIMRIQREIIYGERMQVIEADKSLKNVLIPMIHRTIDHQVASLLKVNARNGVLTHYAISFPQV